MHDRCEVPAVLLEKVVYCRDVSNVNLMMLIAREAGDELIARFAGRRFFTKETFSHVIVDADDKVTVMGKVFDRL
jgi:hypothetical protein